MLDDYLAGDDGPAFRASLARRLVEAPWSWPRADLHPEAFAWARDLVRQDGPRALEPGEVLLLSFREDRAAPDGMGRGGLFPLRLADEAAHAGARAVDGQAAWQAAASALPGAAALLWRSPRLRGRSAERDTLRLLPESAPRALPCVPEEGPSPSVAQSLAGASFGLSFLLAQASRLWGLPLPLDVAATAELTAEGKLCPVRGLEAKVRILLGRAPQVRRLLVARAQADAASDVVAAALAAARSRDGVRGRGPLARELVVVPCDNAAAALRVVWPDLEETWAALGQDDARREELVDDLLRLALADRGEVPNWLAVHRAATVAGARWAGATPAQQGELRLVAAIAARHEGRCEQVAPPDAEVLAEVPQPRRLELVRQFVQQAADTGTNDPTAIVALARAHLVRGAEAFPDHLRLQGAFGRLLANLDQPREALELQLDAAEGWLRRGVPGEVNYPLAAAYRVAAELGDRAAFEDTRALDARARVRRLIAPDGLPWVEVQRARACVALGQDDEARRVLDDVAPRSAPWQELPWSYTALRQRHALGLADAPAGLTRAADLRDALRRRAADAAREAAEHCAAGRHAEASQAERVAQNGESCLCLLELDRALREGDRSASAAAAAAARLEALQGDLVRFLRAARSGVADWPRALASAFPYDC